MYPKLNPWVKLNTDPQTGDAFLTDEMYGDRYPLGPHTAALLSRLDGRTDPFSVDCGMDREEIGSVLDNMEEDLLIRRGRWRRISVGTGFLPLYEFPEHVDPGPARIIATVLRIIWFPLLALGIWGALRGAPDPELDELFIGLFLGLVTGMMLHEAAHSVMAVAYGATPYEAGIMLSGFRPCGYVTANSDEIRSMAGKVRFSLAGVGMNCILFGLFLLPSLLGVRNSGFSETCAVAGLVNMLLGISNLAQMSGVDGCSAMGYLLGNEDYVEDAASLILSPRRLKKVRSLGINGHAAILAAWLSFIPYLTVPAVAVLLIKGVLVWFQ